MKFTRHPFGTITLFSVLVLAGFGCAAKNPTPFTLPTNSPPAPIGNVSVSTSTTADQKKDVNVTLYLVAYENTPAWTAAAKNPGAEKIGCNDYVTPVKTTIKGNPLSPLRLALEVLFSTTKADAAKLGLNTAVNPNMVKTASLSQQTDGTFVVSLTGGFSPAGECDDPRIKAQVEKTVSQFGKYKILLNGSEANWRCLGDLSGKCK